MKKLANLVLVVIAIFVASTLGNSDEFNYRDPETKPLDQTDHLATTTTSEAPTVRDDEIDNSKDEVRLISISEV